MTANHIRTIYVKLNFFTFSFIVYTDYKTELFPPVIHFTLIEKTITDNSNLLLIYNVFKTLRAEAL